MAIPKRVAYPASVSDDWCEECGTRPREHRATCSQFTVTPTARALRTLQVLDQAMPLDPHRHLLIEAQTHLGEALGLECTGEVDGRNADGSPAYYSHNGDTCPIHEWLVPADDATVERGRRNCAQ